MPKRGRQDENEPSPPLSGNADIWSRILKRRRRDLSSLENAFIYDLLKDYFDQITPSEAPADDFLFWLQHHLENSANSSLSAQKRRSSWNAVSTCLARLDAQLGRETEHSDSAVANSPAQPVHPSFQRTESQSTTAGGATSLARSTSRAAAPAAPAMHPALQSRTASSATHTHPALQKNTSSSNRASGSPPTHPSLSNRNSLTSATTSTASTSGGSNPTHPSLRKANTAPTIVSTAPSTVPVHPSFQNQSSVRNMQSRTPAFLNATSTATSNTNKLPNSGDKPVHPSLQNLNSQAAKAASSSTSRRPSSGIDSVHAPLTNASTPAFRPTHPSLRHSHNSATSAVQNTAQTTSNNRLVHPSLREKNKSASSAAQNTATTTAPTHPSLRNTSISSTGKKKPSTTAEPVHPALTGGSSSSLQRASPTPTNASTDKRNDKAKENKQPRTIQSSAFSAKPSVSAPEPTYETVESSIRLNPDGLNPSRSGAVHERSACKVFFKKIKDIPCSTVKSVGERFSAWEPNWKMHREIQFGLTTPSTNVKWVSFSAKNDKRTQPKSAAYFVVSQSLLQDDTIDKVKNWGVERLEPPKDGEFRLIFRMLPVKRDTKKVKRADCHLWPKGTFLCVNGIPVPLSQRKQQSHDLNKWLGMCHHLDLGSVIKFPLQKNKIEIACRDSELYYFSLALCEYRSPDTLIKEMLAPDSFKIQRLSLQDSMEKANKSLSHTVVLDDSDDEGSIDMNNDDQKFVFSLIDPISKVPMKSPVRGKNCNHWQCFDLSKFMQSNERVSGNRWRCVSCENFLPYHELQLCGLTSAAVQKFESEVNSNRGSVQYSINGNYELLPPAKLRHSNKKRSAKKDSGNLQGGQSVKQSDEAEEIVLLD